MDLTFESMTMSGSHCASPIRDPAEAVEFWDMTNRQDWEVCSRTFAGFSSRATNQGLGLPTSP